MHARGKVWLGKQTVGAECALKETEICAERIPAAELRKLTPDEAERWVVKIGLTEFKGRISTNGIDGRKLARFPLCSVTEIKAELKITMTETVRLKNEIRKGVSHSVDELGKVKTFSVQGPLGEEERRCGIRLLLERSLAINVADRPATADSVFGLLGGVEKLDLKEDLERRTIGTIEEFGYSESTSGSAGQSQRSLLSSYRSLRSFDQEAKQEDEGAATPTSCQNARYLSTAGTNTVLEVSFFDVHFKIG